MSARHKIKNGRVPASRFDLPGRLPEGERILWQGAPDWWALARNALHVRGMALYLALAVGWVFVSATRHGMTVNDIAFRTACAALAAMVPVAFAVGYAWLAARGSAYTITNRRVVIRLGVAYSLTINLPFAKVDGASMVVRADGTGDVAIKLARDAKGLGWLLMWPHARPWRFGQAALRSVPDAAAAGRILSRALAEYMDMPVPLASDAKIVDSAECKPNATPSVVAA